MEYSKRTTEHKHLTKGHGVKNYVPYQQNQYSNQGSQAQQGATGQQNTFTQGQTDTQGQLGGLWQSLLGGNIPSSFTNPAAATNAYQSNFNTQVAPGLAAQYGAGSPVIGSQNALGMAQLQGQLYNTGVGNFLSAMQGGTNYALGMPTGGTGTTQQAAASQNSGTGQTDINPLALALQSLLGGGP